MLPRTAPVLARALVVGVAVLVGIPVLVGIAVLEVIVLLVIVLEVIELDAVKLVESVGRVGLAVGIRLGGPGEGIPGLVRAPGRQQRIRVGVEEPPGPWP